MYFRVYLINILWKKIRQNFFQKKVVRNFLKGTPFGICMKSNNNNYNNLFGTRNVQGNIISISYGLYESRHLSSSRIVERPWPMHLGVNYPDDKV